MGELDAGGSVLELVLIEVRQHFTQLGACLLVGAQRQVRHMLVFGVRVSRSQRRSDRLLAGSCLLRVCEGGRADRLRGGVFGQDAVG